MTNAIEQSKREMYAALEALNSSMMSTGSKERGQTFESSLESHLELLRQSLVTANRTITDCAAQSLSQIRDLESRLAKMTEERDSIQLRLHAVDHAYNEQQSRGATSVSNSVENVSSATPDGKTAAILGAVVDVQRIVTDWAQKGLKAKQAMYLISSAVNGDPAVLQAMLEFEGQTDESAKAKAKKLFMDVNLFKRPEPIEKDEACKIGEKNWREIAEAEERFEEMKANAAEGKRRYEARIAAMNAAFFTAVIGGMTGAFSKPCQHSFFAIGDETQKCIYCCEVAA